MRKTLHDPYRKLTIVLPVIDELTYKDITEDLLGPALKTLKDKTVVRTRSDDPVYINDVQLQHVL